MEDVSDIFIGVRRSYYNSLLGKVKHRLKLSQSIISIYDDISELEQNIGKYLSKTHDNKHVSPIIICLINK
jgi:hypothetical protein